MKQAATIFGVYEELMTLRLHEETYSQIPKVYKPKSVSTNSWDGSDEETEDEKIDDEKTEDEVHDQPQNTPLLKHGDVVRIVWRIPCDNPLRMAIKMRNLTAVRRWLDFGAEVNAQDFTGFTPLMDAIETQQIEIIKELLLRDADPNTKTRSGETPLHLAVNKRSLQIVKLLMKAGAQPRVRNADGKTPADIIARFEPYSPIVKALDAASFLEYR